MNSWLVYDRTQHVATIAIHTVLLVRHPDRGFPPSEIPAVGRVVMPTCAGGRFTTVAQQALG